MFFFFTIACYFLSRPSSDSDTFRRAAKLFFFTIRARKWPWSTQAIAPLPQMSDSLDVLPPGERDGEFSSVFCRSRIDAE